MNRPTLEVADIVHAAGNRFWERHGSHLAWQVLTPVRVRSASCYTATTGGSCARMEVHVPAGCNCPIIHGDGPFRLTKTRSHVTKSFGQVVIAGSQAPNFPVASRKVFCTSVCTEFASSQ
jgi:hypothetical protein